MNAVVKHDPADAIENVLINGDLGQLTPQQRVEYYNRVCNSLGLNHLTQPFDYLRLNNKLVLYAKRNCTDQLRRLRKISVTDMSDVEHDGIIVVTAKVLDVDGRTDIAKGAVAIGGLKGEALANAVMKAETKAKRRATLSICGLGLLDEIEVETIPAAAKGENRFFPSPSGRKSSAQSKRDGDWDKFKVALADCQSAAENERLREEYRRDVYPSWKTDWVDVAEEEFDKSLALFSQTALQETLQDSVKQEEERQEETQPVMANAATRAMYVRGCHTIIDEAQSDHALLAWWNDEGNKKTRRALPLTKEELKDLMQRVTRRVEELRRLAEARANE